MQIVYVALCVLGAVLPLSQFVPWLAEHGPAVPLLFQQAFGSSVSSFAWLDVLVSAAVVVVFVSVESHRLGMRRRWIPLLCLVTVGVSLALPVFLLMREKHQKARRA